MAAVVAGAAAPKLGYRPELDGLRALAVCAVILDHTYLPGFEGGGIGVDVFFALSGFLITALLLNEWQQGGISLRSFWWRRALRLLPCLFAVVATCVVLLPWLPSDTERGIMPALLYHSNWFRAFVGDTGALGHTWSLAIEEQFYLVWPLLLLGLLKVGGPRLALRFSVIGAVGVLLVRELAAPTLGVDRVYNGSDMRADGLLWGCALALALHLGWRLHRGSGLAAVTLVAVWAVRGYVHMPWAERSIAALATCVLIAAATPRIRAALSHPVLTWTGRRAYGLYLWHYVLARLLLEFDHSVQRVVVMLIATFVVAAASYRWIESPFLRLKDLLRVGDDRDRAAGERHVICSVHVADLGTDLDVARDGAR